MQRPSMNVWLVFHRKEKQRRKDIFRDEDQMIISKDSIDRFLKYNDTNSQSTNQNEGSVGGGSAVPKMSNLIIAMALQNNFCTN